MEAGLVDRIEKGTSHGAAALFGVAAGYAAYSAASVWGLAAPLRSLSVAAALIAYFGCHRLLAAVPISEAQFRHSSFEPVVYEPAWEADILLLDEADRRCPTELVLGEADRLHASGELLLTDAVRLRSAEPLVLDDVLAAVNGDSRVVRLFDPRAMPTPGRLHSRIANHVGQTRDISTHDASGALSEALKQLRASLG